MTPEPSAAALSPAWGGPGVLTVGLTGGIASGKSTVARALVKRGFRRIDADEIVHALLAPDGDAFAEVVSHFGPTVLDSDGRISRAKLAAIVFESAWERRALEAMLHPRVLVEQKRRLDAWESEGFSGVALVEAALLLEAGAGARFDRIVVVGARPDTQLRRLEAAGMEPEEARSRIAAQLPVDEKVRAADYVIPNDGSTEDLSRAVDELAGRLLDDLEHKRLGTLEPSTMRRALLPAGTAP